MTTELVRQLLLMILEGLIVAGLLLALFRLRGALGLVPIYTTVAIFYQMANLLAGTVYIKIPPDLTVSPGSVVLFPAILLSVLFVYMRGDAEEARKFIYGLLAGDLVVAALGLVIAQHFGSPLFVNPHNLSPAVFLQQPRILVVGTIALFADTVLIILAYELVSRVSPRLLLFVRLSIAMVAILVFDTLFFVTGSFVESDAYLSILISGMVGKSIAGVFYAGILTLYLRLLDVAEGAPLGAARPLGDLFDILTYRQKYEALKAQVTRDALTGVYNRAFFDESADLLLAGSRRTGAPVTLMMIDVDHFKQVNDTYGHRAGDQVLQAIAGAIAATSRGSDLVCRYGGEEFAVLLPDTDLERGIRLAERIRHEVPRTLARLHPRWSSEPITTSIGLACFPDEATSTEELIGLADRRLYQGKVAGRNRVVPGRMEAADDEESGVSGHVKTASQDLPKGVS